MNKRKRRVLSGLLALAVAGSLSTAAYADGGTSLEEAVANDDGTVKLTVYNQEDYNSDPVVAKEYTITDLYNNAVIGTPYGYQYYKTQTWSVWCAEIYVTLDQLLSDSATTEDYSTFADDQMAVIVSAADGFSHTLTYDKYINARNFYPDAGPDDMDNMDNQETVLPVIGLSWDGGTPVAEGSTSGTTVQSMLDTAYYSGSLRLFYGVKEEDFLETATNGTGAGGSTTVAGNRSVSGVTSITVVKDATYDYLISFHTSTQKPYQNFYLDEGDLIPLPEKVPDVYQTKSGMQADEYQFDYWYYLDSEGNQVAYTAEDTATEERVYYPAWKEAALTYECNDETTDVLKASVTAAGSEELTLSYVSEDGTSVEVTEDYTKLADVLTAAGITLPEDYCSVTLTDAYGDEETLTAAQMAEAYIYVESDSSGNILGYRAALDGASEDLWLSRLHTVTVNPDHSYGYDHVCTVCGTENPGSEACVSAAFTDMPAFENWAHKGIDYVVANGYMSGTSATTFEPKQTTTRAQLLRVLYELSGDSAPAYDGSFQDVQDGKWYTDAIAWAVENNITSGYGNGYFGTYDPVTREQMASFLYRYAQYKGYDVTATADLSAYTDQSDVASYATTAVSWANAEGILAGTSSTTLSPKGSATREQMAAIIMRFDLLES